MCLFLLQRLQCWAILERIAMNIMHAVASWLKQEHVEERKQERGRDRAENTCFTLTSITRNTELGVSWKKEKTRHIILLRNSTKPQISHQWHWFVCTQVHVLQQPGGCGKPGTCVSEDDSRFKSWHANILVLKPFRHTSLITAIKAAMSILMELDAECWPNKKHETLVVVFFFYKEVGCYSNQDMPPIYRTTSTIWSASFMIHDIFSVNWCWQPINAVVMD